LEDLVEDACLRQRFVSDSCDFLPQNTKNGKTKVTMNIESDRYLGTSVHCGGDKGYFSGDSSEGTYATFASTVVATEEDEVELRTSVPDEAKDVKRRFKKAYKWYKTLARPTRETMCCVIDFTRGLDITRECVGFLPWNWDESKVDEEAISVLLKAGKKNKNEKPSEKMRKSGKGKDSIYEFRVETDQLEKDTKNMKSIRSELDENMKNLDKDSSNVRESLTNWDSDQSRLGGTIAKYEKALKGRLLGAREDRVRDDYNRRKKERRRRRDEAHMEEERSKPVKESIQKAAKKASKKATERFLDEDDGEIARRHRAYSWYSRMARPDRNEFKKRVELMNGADISPADVDLLPWNFSGSVVNIAKMNKIIRDGIR
jgi:hypothetical protein